MGTTSRLESLVVGGWRMLSGEAGEECNDDVGDGQRALSGGCSQFGVHISFDILFHAVVFLAATYVAGQISSRLLAMPSLVGEIVSGILLGPGLADFVPNPEAFVILGEIGLILLVLEAGIDIDMTTLKLIGTRGILIAVVGSILPIAIGIAIAFAFGVDLKGALAAGAAFGPTSLGIAVNILRAGKIINTPVGQLVVSAAVIDDMIALIVLSQLEALTGEITVAGVLIPIVSALGFLCIGGYLAICILPNLLQKFVLSHVAQENKGKVELAIMFAMLIALMPATKYAKASYLMGAFVAGLTFCRSHELHHTFVTQFKRLLQWLMRIFFAASIGFQVPIKDLGDGKVIWQGLVFTLALSGKLAVGFLVPNFTNSKRFTGIHFRDCMITGFSMAAEGEFAFVIAVFAVENDLIKKDLYASIVLAILLSTIIPPFLLRAVITHYNKKAEEALALAAAQEVEAEDQTNLLESGKNREGNLRDGIKKGKTVFVCIQTQSRAHWGLLHDLMNCMNKSGLDIIDHRSWHPRGVDTTLVNEVYAKGDLQGSDQTPEERIDVINDAILEIMPDEAKVKVQRWFPGVVEEITEETIEKSKSTRTRTSKLFSLEERVLKEATDALEKKRERQTLCTKEKSVDEIVSELSPNTIQDIPDFSPNASGGGVQQRAPRRRLQKMRSTPVVGGGLFGETAGTSTSKKRRETTITDSTFTGGNIGGSVGHSAELVISGESYHVKVSDATYKNVKKGYSGDMLSPGGISIIPAAPVVSQLHGFVRNNASLGQIEEEEHYDTHSEISEGTHNA